MLPDFLNDYYQADLKLVHHGSGNRHFVGYSEVYHCDLFVKVFRDKAMFYAEQHVNQVYAPDIYLDAVIFGDYYVIVLKDRELTDIVATAMTQADARHYGQILADFHNQVTGRVAVREDKRSLQAQIDELVLKLAKMPYADQIQAAREAVETDLAKAQQEYEQLPQVVLHGDFSVRNLMEYHDDVILLDFEWARTGVAFQDFIKFLYNEVKDQQLRQAFIAGYQQKRDFEIPTASLQRCLLLLAGLRICEFHATHPKKKFGQMAQDMFGTVIAGSSVLAL